MFTPSTEKTSRPVVFADMCDETDSENDFDVNDDVVSYCCSSETTDSPDDFDRLEELEVFELLMDRVMQILRAQSGTQKMYDEIISLNISDNGTMKELVSLIFEAATIRHDMIDVYAELCFKLNIWFSEIPATADFKQVLLSTCQAFFTANLWHADELDRGEAASEEYNRKVKVYMMRVMGNVQFVAKLVTGKLIAIKVCTMILQSLTEKSTKLTAIMLVQLLDSLEAGCNDAVLMTRLHNKLDPLVAEAIQSKSIHTDNFKVWSLN